jgi:hypothetical protein
MSQKSRVVQLAVAGLFFIYAGARILFSISALNNPSDTPDTTAYLRVSREPLTDVDFWGSTRPLGFPLLLKLVDQDIENAAALQLGLSILSWGLLGWMSTRFLRPLWLKPIAFGLILALSLDRHIAGWDFVMLSESLSISFLTLFTAIGLWLLQGWRIGKVICLCITGLFMAFTRDTNAWLLLMLAGLLMVATLLRWAESRSLILASAFALTFFLSNANADVSSRWFFPLANLIGRRVLPDPHAVAFLSSCGMPVTPALLDQSGNFANDDERALLADPELESFRVWLHDHGKSCYMRWLLSDPIGSSRKVWREFDFLIAFSKVNNFFSRTYDPLMPIRLGQVFYPERYSLWIWVISTAAALVAIWKKSWRENPLWVAFILINLTIFPHLFLTWHGDAMAPERHALSVGVQLYLGFWLMVILLLEWLWARKAGIENQQLFDR